MVFVRVRISKKNETLVQKIRTYVQNKRKKKVWSERKEEHDIGGSFSTQVLKRKPCAFIHSILEMNGIV